MTDIAVINTSTAINVESIGGPGPPGPPGESSIEALYEAGWITAPTVEALEAKLAEIATAASAILISRPITTDHVVTSDDFGCSLDYFGAPDVTVVFGAALADNSSGGWAQFGTGLFNFAAGIGATVANRQGFNQSAGQYAGGTWRCVNPTGVAALIVLYGDLA